MRVFCLEATLISFPNLSAASAISFPTHAKQQVSPPSSCSLHQAHQ
jgi:hypothetical protein